MKKLWRSNSSQQLSEKAQNKVTQENLFDKNSSSHNGESKGKYSHIINEPSFINSPTYKQYKNLKDILKNRKTPNWKGYAQFQQSISTLKTKVY